MVSLLLLQGKGNASTVEQLDALMHEIGSSKERYEKMLAWKHKKVRSRWQLSRPLHAISAGCCCCLCCSTGGRAAYWLSLCCV
jgi:hypothetical protein